MKALLCSQCVDIRALNPDGSWTTCRCGACSARWEDPRLGTVRVRAKFRSLPRIIGFHNSFLIHGMQAGMDDSDGFENTDEAWRRRHEAATNTPGYVFDKKFRGCWACIFKVGETGDVRWEELQGTLEEKSTSLDTPVLSKSEPPETGHTD